MISPESHVRVVSDEQGQALASAMVACEAEQDGDRAVTMLATRVRAILGAAVLVFCRRTDGWSELTRRPGRPAPPPVARALDAVGSAEAGRVHYLAGENWTLFRDAADTPDIIVAIEGDWTLSDKPLSALTLVVRTKLDRVGARAATRTVARLHHRMMYRLARVAGLPKIGHVVVWHAAAAVEARLGAIAVIAPGQERASIVATFGYPLALVEHMQIESGTGVIGTVLQSRKPVHETGIVRSMRARRPRYHTASFVAVPILADRDTLGVICVTDKTGDRPFSARDVAVLRTFAAGAALALAREHALNAADVYARAAAVDPVTGLFNRRYLQVRLDEELQRSRRHEIPLALLLLDLDDFKVVNDSYGHLAGDIILRDIGEILRSCVRVFDVCARFGGEEFVIIMPGGTNENALRIAERVRQRVEAYRPSDESLRNLRVTVSVGFTVSTSSMAANELLERSDKALYAAKRAGKNRIRSADDLEASENR